MSRRTMFRYFSLLILALGIATPTFLAATPSDFKQLAGPADEMAAMRLPNPLTLGQRSKAAMLPIQSDGTTWSARLPVDDTKDLKMLLLAPNSEGWSVRLATPRGERLDLRAEAAGYGITRELSAVSFDGDNFPAEVYTFDKADTGLWTVEIDAPATKGETIGYLVVSSLSPYRLYSYVNTNETTVGNLIGLTAFVYDQSDTREANLKLPAPLALAGTLREATARIQAPGGKVYDITLSDAQRGILSGSFTPAEAGRYLTQITARGVTPEGQEFIRTAEHIFQVTPNRADLGHTASISPIDNLRSSVTLQAHGLKAGQKVLGYGEIWGRDAKGQPQPVAWIGGLTLVEGKNPTVSFGLDSRWLGLSDTDGPYELRNVRLQDPDYFVTQGQAASLALPGLARPAMSRSVVRQITDDMRTGPRPERAVTPNAPGGKLMLIHGYCSGSNPWPAAQFSNAVVFNDPNQNRTHDQFANLIKNFGASLPSFGAVAHSQGGAASLHLYTYYWSGLDYATGTRLIQSVGTPYQGTALAGNLALLGQIFGAGCGSNNNLSYSGAAAWLAGIPAARRAKVYFATTSFTDVWWKYDYCNIATDPFLSDPEDGVVEQAKGQLSGGNNRGHKTGWCHTSGMRDPAQTSDATRNADMNTNAAR